MLTFADIVAASTVKTWSDCADCGRCRCAARPDNSSSSSDGSTVTATTVRTVVNKSSVPETEDLGTPSGGNSSTETPGTRKTGSSASRSKSRPASERVRQLTTAASSRARSVSQPRPTSSALVPTGHRNVKSRSPRLNNQSKQ